MGSRWRKQSTAQRLDGARVNRPTADHALVLGIDPGSAITGYAVVEVNARGDASLVEAGALRLKRSETLTQRLAALASDMDALFQEHAFTHIAVETIFSHPSHVQSALQMGHARGVVRRRSRCSKQSRCSAVSRSRPRRMMWLMQSQLHLRRRGV